MSDAIEIPEPETPSPGIALHQLLKDIFPYESGAAPSAITRIDEAILGDGQLTSLVYESCINYLFRRLVNTARYLHSSVVKKGGTIGDLHAAIRKFISNQLNLNVASITAERIEALLYACVVEAEGRLSQGRKERIRELFKARGIHFCYICGQEFDYDHPGEGNYPEVDHVFPRSLGGTNEDFNLRLACAKCNRNKEHCINFSDFHYEHMALRFDSADEEFTRRFLYKSKVASWLRNDSRCAVCGANAESCGEMRFTRNNLDDGWHFLNIITVCAEHDSV